MDEIRLIGFSETDIDLILNVKGFEGFTVLTFNDFESSLQTKISPEATHSFVLFELFDESYELFWQQTKLQLNPSQIVNFCYLFPYGQLDLAKSLQTQGRINFYLQRPYSNFLLVSSLLAMYYNKTPLSHVIEEVLELSLDSGSDDVSEYMAQFRRKLFTNY